VSVVILGGNECMERRYKDMCSQYDCDVKVFTKHVGSLRRKIGNPDLMIFFMSTMSHKMVSAAMSETKSLETVIERSHSSSASALRSILEAHAVKAVSVNKKDKDR